MHGAKKFFSTLRIAYTLIMARTFGEYIHSLYLGEIEGAVYHYRGQRWFFPTSSMDDNWL